MRACSHKCVGPGARCEKTAAPAAPLLRSWRCHKLPSVRQSSNRSCGCVRRRAVTRSVTNCFVGIIWFRRICITSSSRKEGLVNVHVMISHSKRRASNSLAEDMLSRNSRSWFAETTKCMNGQLNEPQQPVSTAWMGQAKVHRRHLHVRCAFLHVYANAAAKGAPQVELWRRASVRVAEPCKNARHRAKPNSAEDHGPDLRALEFKGAQERQQKAQVLWPAAGRTTADPSSPVRAFLGA